MALNIRIMTLGFKGLMTSQDRSRQSRVVFSTQWQGSSELYRPASRLKPAVLAMSVLDWWALRAVCNRLVSLSARCSSLLISPPDCSTASHDSHHYHTHYYWSFSRCKNTNTLPQFTCQLTAAKLTDSNSARTLQSFYTIAEHNSLV